jgi:mercuric ion transport protein
MDKARLAALGGIGAGIASALCCVGPLVAVAIGVSGAGLAATFEPLRPYFLGAAGLSLGAGFFWVSREDQKACEPGKPCASPEVRRRMKRWLWIATVIGIAFGSFPWWSKFVLT